MPNKQSRKQTTRQMTAATRGPNGTANSTSLNVWASSLAKYESKYNLNVWSNQQLYHNVGTLWNATANLLDNISTGATVTTRVGNSIFVKGIEFRFVLNNKTDRPNVSYRVILAATPTTVSSDTFGEIVSSAQFTGVHLPVSSVMLHDVTFPSNQGSGMENNITPNKERSFNHTAYVPINRSVTYGADGACQTRLVGYIVPFDAFGTLTTDNICSVAQASIRIDFADP